MRRICDAVHGLSTAFETAPTVDRHDAGATEPPNGSGPVVNEPETIVGHTPGSLNGGLENPSATWVADPSPSASPMSGSVLEVVQCRFEPCKKAFPIVDADEATRCAGLDEAPGHFGQEP